MVGRVHLYAAYRANMKQRGLIPPLFRSEIKRAYEHDKTAKVADIAKDFGVGKSYPSALAKRDGLQMRRPRQQLTKHEKDEPR